MERRDAIKKLRRLEGQDLRKLADRYKVTVWREGKLNTNAHYAPLHSHGLAHPLGCNRTGQNE